MPITFPKSRDLISSKAKEGISASKLSDGSFKTWALDAAEELMDDIATENLQFHDNLIRSNGHADYTAIQADIPAAQLATAFDTGSIYIRSSDISRRPLDQRFFAIIKGTAYSFVNKKQAVIWYTLLLTYISVAHLQDLQATNPSTARASLITKHEDSVAADITVFCANASATYNTRTGFDNGVELNLYDPTIT